MDLTKGLKTETIEALAALKPNKNWKTLVKVLRLNQDNYGKACLKQRTTDENWLAIHDLQEKSAAFSFVIKVVDDAYNKLNKE